MKKKTLVLSYRDEGQGGRKATQNMKHDREKSGREGGGAGEKDISI